MVIATVKKMEWGKSILLGKQLYKIFTVGSIWKTGFYGEMKYLGCNCGIKTIASIVLAMVYELRNFHIQVVKIGFAS